MMARVGGGGHPLAAVTNAAWTRGHACSLESLPSTPPGPCPRVGLLGERILFNEGAAFCHHGW